MSQVFSALYAPLCLRECQGQVPSLHHLKATSELQAEMSQVCPDPEVMLRMHAKSLQLYLSLCDRMACSPPGSSVHGTLQARILEWVARLSSVFLL